MDTFQQTATQTRGLMTDSRGVMREARTAIVDTRGVVKDASELVRSTNTVVQNSGGLVTETRAALAENRQKLTAVFDNLNTSLKTLDATLTDTRGLLNDEKLRSDFKATAENLRNATETLKKIGEDVRSVTGDPKVQDDLRVTVSNLRQVSEQTSAVLDRVQTVLGKTGGSARSIGEKLKDTGFRTDLTYATRQERARFDINATIPWTDDSFFRLGMYDFGEDNHFNAQYGYQLRKNIWARGGFYASKLGFGLDIGNPKRPHLGLDVFGVDDPQIDVRANIPLFRNFDLTLGLDRLQSRPDPVIGLRYSR
jgi:phospholipid/cholesterol/gamma-HCH transport system substrate-binding protein